MLSKNDYDVVLLDIVLPKVSGTQVMEHLCATNPAMLERIIVVTGLNVEDIRKLFPTVCHALSKPVIPNRLMDTIHSASTRTWCRASTSACCAPARRRLQQRANGLGQPPGIQAPKRDGCDAGIAERLAVIRCRNRGKD